jgi:hypothetical protein
MLFSQQPRIPPKGIYGAHLVQLSPTPLLTAAMAGPGGGPRSADRNPSVLDKPLLRPSDRVDQHVS